MTCRGAKINFKPVEVLGTVCLWQPGTVCGLTYVLTNWFIAYRTWAWENGDFTNSLLCFPRNLLLHTEGSLDEFDVFMKFYCRERFKEAEIGPLYWNSEGPCTFKYYRKLNFTKTSTRARVIFDATSVFNEVPKALACERNFIGTYMSFQRMFTPETVVLCLGNSCILVFNSLARCNRCSSHAQHGTNPSLCFELQNYCLVVLHSLPRFALWLLASALLFESTSSEQRNLLARVTGHSCTSAHQLL